MKTIPKHVTTPAPLQQFSQRLILQNIKIIYPTLPVFRKIG